MTETESTMDALRAVVRKALFPYININYSAAAADAILTAVLPLVIEDIATFVEKVTNDEDTSDIGEQIAEEGWNAAPYKESVSVKLEWHGKALASAIRGRSYVSHIDALLADEKREG